MNKKLPLAVSLLFLAVVGCSKTPVESETTKPTEEPVSEKIVECTITFYVGNSVYSTSKVNQGNKVTKPADPTKEGYLFTGWYTSELCLEGEKFDFDKNVINDNISLYAGFEEDLSKAFVTVLFDLNGGSWQGENSVTVKKGMTVSEPVRPTKDGYEFVGWSLTKDDETHLFDFTTPINENITLHAVYHEIIITPLYKVEASSQDSLANQANCAVDGNEATYWKAADKERQTLLIDLESVKEVKEVSQEFNDLNTWDFVIEGSLDNVNYATLLHNEAKTSGTKYSTSVIGFYRYIRLTIEKSEVVATSKEFAVSYTSLEHGTNIAYGMKGISDCHAGGFEPEKMFDGDLGNYHCASGNHANHYMGIDANKNFYIENVELNFPDSTDHKFIIDYRLPDSSWKNLEGGDFNENTEAKDQFTIPVNAELSAMLVHYNGNSTDNWPAMKEMRAYGFKDFTTVANNEVKDNKDVYDCNSLSYISRIALNNKEGTNRKIEISIDGKTWKNVDMNQVEGEFILVNEDARYVRYSDERGEITKGNLKIYGIQYYRNVAMLTNPSATTRSGDSGFWENMMTFNKDCAQASGRFYCTGVFNNVEEIKLDLGNMAYVESIKYQFQDETTENIQCLKLEVSKNGTDYQTLFDNLANPSSGKTYVVKTTEETKKFRHLRITVQLLNNWTNCNTLELFGIGNPVL